MRLLEFALTSNSLRTKKTCKGSKNLIWNKAESTEFPYLYWARDQYDHNLANREGLDIGIVVQQQCIIARLAMPAMRLISHHIVDVTLHSADGGLNKIDQCEFFWADRKKQFLDLPWSFACSAAAVRSPWRTCPRHRTSPRWYRCWPACRRSGRTGCRCTQSSTRPVRPGRCSPPLPATDRASPPRWKDCGPQSQPYHHRRGPPGKGKCLVNTRCRKHLRQTRDEMEIRTGAE